jgi:hypothetical protein
VAFQFTCIGFKLVLEVIKRIYESGFMRPGFQGTGSKKPGFQGSESLGTETYRSGFMRQATYRSDFS